MSGPAARLPRAARRRLGRGGHAVFELASGLLLVFKPRGHREAAHAHAWTQRLRVLRGVLEVRTARGVRRIDAASGAVRIAAGRVHTTSARADTWLIAERLAGPLRPPPTPGRARPVPAASPARPRRR